MRFLDAAAIENRTRAFQVTESEKRKISLWLGENRVLTMEPYLKKLRGLTTVCTEIRKVSRSSFFTFIS